MNEKMNTGAVSETKDNVEFFFISAKFKVSSYWILNPKWFYILTFRKITLRKYLNG